MTQVFNVEARVELIREDQEFEGSFNLSIAVFSVSRKGELKLVRRSSSCTLQGDRPSVPALVKADEPLLVVVSRHGNGAWDQVFATASGADRLVRNELEGEDAFKRWARRTSYGLLGN